MTQENKKLLLKDLCARLPYGVMVDRLGVPRKVLSIKTDSIEIDRGEYMPASYHLDEVKPYLRPMSSMTEEEKKELNNVLEFQYYSDDSCMCESTDWLNAHHFDMRNLIEKGLAIDCTGLNIYLYGRKERCLLCVIVSRVWRIDNY